MEEPNHDNTRFTVGKEDHSTLKLLSRISRSLNVAGRNLEESLDEVCRTLHAELPIDGVALWTKETPTTFMKIEASAGLSERYIRFVNKNDRLHLGESVTGQTMTQKEAVQIENLEEYLSKNPLRWMEMLYEEGFRSLIAVPVIVHAEAIGTLELYYRTLRKFPEHELLFFETLANQVAVVLSNHTQLETISRNAAILRDQMENIVRIQELTELMNLYLHDSLNVSLSHIAEYFAKQFDTKAVAVFKADESAHTLHLVASHGFSERTLAYFSENPPSFEDANLVSLAYRTKEPQLSRRMFTDERIAKEWIVNMSIEGETSIGTFPLAVQGRTIGVFASFYERIHDFSEEELSTLGTFAEFFASALENSDTLHKLTNEQRKTSSMVNAIEDGLLVFDLKKRMIAANPKAMQLFGISDIARAIGKRTEEIGGSDAVLLAPLIKIAQVTLAENESKEIDLPELGDIVLRIREVTLKDEANAPIGAMRILHDITRERSIEKLKSNFVSTASHQLRTPLTGIKWGLLNVLEQHSAGLSSEQKNIIERVVGVSENVITLINDLLNVSRMEEGRLEYHFSHGNIDDLIDGIIKEFALNIEKQEITVERIPTAEKLEVMRDPEKISMAIRNILDNAIKYTLPHGKITITTRRGEKYLIIEITDNGIGVPESEQPMLFNKFYRATNATRLHTAGSGLGLFIAKSIIDRHNGSITFSSHEKVGTTFRIALPIENTPTKDTPLA